MKMYVPLLLNAPAQFGKIRRLFKIFFVPDSIRPWNLLKAEAREAISIKLFRKNISVEIANPPSYYAFGKRFINIIHPKLRHKCILHYDFYKHNITNTRFYSLFMWAKRRFLLCRLPALADIGKFAHKIISVTFFSGTTKASFLIFETEHQYGELYCGTQFWICGMSTSCFTRLLILWT